jgi:hypothetical protein
MMKGKWLLDVGPRIGMLIYIPRTQHRILFLLQTSTLLSALPIAVECRGADSERKIVRYADMLLWENLTVLY